MTVLFTTIGESKVLASYAMRIMRPEVNMWVWETCSC
jgi:hypothetical protein